VTEARQALARRAEAEVAALLTGRGFVVLGSNVRVGRLELDVIARKRDLLVVVEVRARSTDAFGDPLETIDAKKVARIRRATSTWLAARPDLRGVRVRFDAVGIVVRGDRLELDWCEDAF
jgi:putative endonuclease